MSTGAYRALLRRPGVGWQALTGLFAQVTQGAGAVGIILVIKQHSGSLALAGAVVGALSIAVGVARPIQGRMIDRRGSAGVMALCALAHSASLVVIVALAGAGAPAIPLVVAGACAGLALPPVSTSMRVVWGDAVAAGQRVSAYSLTFLVQELSILAGPLLLAAVLAVSTPSAALLTIALVSGCGTLAFATSVRGTGPDRSGNYAPVGSALRVPGVRLLVAVALLVGGVFGAIEVAAPAAATAHHEPAASGLLIAAVSIGGIAGAALYGNRQWSSAASARLVVLLAGLAASVLLAVPVDGLIGLGVLLLLAGLCLNPALTTISLLVDEQTPGRTAAEAFGWLSTGIAAGGGVTNALAGAVAGRGAGAGPALIVAAVAGVLAVILAVVASRRP